MILGGTQVPGKLNQKTSHAAIVYSLMTQKNYLCLKHTIQFTNITSSACVKPFRIHQIHGDTKDVELKGYKLIRTNHLFDLRKGGVCIY